MWLDPISVVLFHDSHYSTDLLSNKTLVDLISSELINTYTTFFKLSHVVIYQHNYHRIGVVVSTEDNFLLFGVSIHRPCFVTLCYYNRCFQYRLDRLCNNCYSREGLSKLCEIYSCSCLPIWYGKLDATRD